MDQHTLSIGEMSGLFRLNKQTLQYYDSIGLFCPAGRDSNGYRIYYFEQSYKLAAICNMRSLGYSLKTIARILEHLDTDTSLQEMHNRLEIVRGERRKLEHLEQTLEEKISFIQSENRPEKFGSQQVRSFGARYYYPIGKEEALYGEDSFYLKPTLVFYHGSNRRFGAYLPQQPQQPGQRYWPQSQLIAPGEYLCAYHLGPYGGVLDSLARLRSCNRHLALEDWSVHFNIVDQFLENDPQRFVTLLQIPLRQRE